MDEIGEKPVFEDIQRWPMWLRASLTLGTVATAVVCSVLAAKGPDDVGFRVSMIVGGIIVPVAVAVLFWINRMETQVRSDGVYVRFYPFHLHFRRLAVADFDQYMVERVFAGRDFADECRSGGEDG